MKVKLKKATLEETQIILDIAKKGGVFVYPKRLLEYVIKKKCVTLLNIAATTVGYISYVIFPKLQAVYVLQIAITPKHQGHNIGTTALGRLCVFWKKKWSIEKVYLHTFKKKVFNWMRKRDFKSTMNIADQIWILDKTL